MPHKTTTRAPRNRPPTRNASKSFQSQLLFQLAALLPPSLSSWQACRIAIGGGWPISRPPALAPPDQRTPTSRATGLQTASIKQLLLNIFSAAPRSPHRRFAVPVAPCAGGQSGDRFAGHRARQGWLARTIEVSKPAMTAVNMILFPISDRSRKGPDHSFPARDHATTPPFRPPACCASGRSARHQPAGDEGRGQPDNAPPTMLQKQMSSPLSE